MKKNSLLHPIVTPFAKMPIGHRATAVFFWLFSTIYIWSIAGDPIPKPITVMQDLIDFAQQSDFWLNLGASLWLTIKAMMFSIILACILAYSSVLGFVKPIVEVLVKIRYMSIMGFVFVFIIMIPSSDVTKMASLMFGIVPFFTLSLVSTIERIPSNFYDIWTTLRYSKWEQVLQVVIIGHMDYLFETIRTNFAICWIMISMVETQVMSDGGLGVMLYKNRRVADLDKQFAIQLVILLLAVMFDYIMQQVRYECFPYVKLSEKK